MTPDTPDAIACPSPNFGERREGASPSLVVLHYTAMANADLARERLCDPAFEVSAHYLIAGNGQVWQLVAEEARAWHAGQGSWGGISDINSHSIGIELDNTGFHPFAAAQMDALENVLSGILHRWAIPPQRVIAHSDMAPERKCDPGPRFNWQRLARRGLSIWPEVGNAATDAEFDTLSRQFGYPAEARQDARLKAFRDRFRPGAEGPVCAQDLALMSDLATRYPVDRNQPNT